MDVQNQITEDQEGKNATDLKENKPAFDAKGINPNPTTNTAAHDFNIRRLRLQSTTSQNRYQLQQQLSLPSPSNLRSLSYNHLESDVDSVELSSRNDSIMHFENSSEHGRNGKMSDGG